MRKTINLDNSKIAVQVANIQNVAKEYDWKYLYDPELDYLYYSPEVIKPGYVLHAVNDEINIYVNDKSELGGIFIEYYKYNLTSHEPRYKEFANIFTKDVKYGKTIPKSREQKTEMLSAILKSDILTNLVNADKVVSIPA